MGRLFLIPVTIGEDILFTIPNYVIEQIHSLDTFIVERAKTARRFIKATEPPYAINELRIFELDKHEPAKGIEAFLEPALKGTDIGLMSEAGCPGVADPGALVIQKAHTLGIEVVPLVGPSSILLALMASGLNGQQFAFHGYLNVKKPGLIKDLKYLEKLALKDGQTQIFIEAPYRNQSILENALQVLQPETLFCVAADIQLPTQFILTTTIRNWQKREQPDLHKRPAVFLIGGKR